MTNEQQLKLQAYLDGELPEREAREVLAWTQRDAAAAALLAELKNTRQALTGAGLPGKVPETREFYWSKIAREIQRPEPRQAHGPRASIFAAWQRFLVPAGAVAVLVIAALFAHLYNPKAVVESVADADATSVESGRAGYDATTFRDTSEGTTLVWFSSTADDSPASDKPPTAIN